MKTRLWLVGAALVLLGIPTSRPSTKWVSPRLFEGTVLEATYQPTAIKSIQQGLLSIAGGSLSNTQAMSAITVGNAAVMATPISANSSSGTLNNGDLCRVSITSTILLTANRDALTGSGSNDAGCSLTWTVLEFVGQFVKQRQTANTSIASTSATASLSPVVVVNKSVCFYAGLSQNAGGVPPGQAYAGCYVSATNAVTLKSGVADPVTLGWTVLEFK